MESIKRLREYVNGIANVSSMTKANMSIYIDSIDKEVDEMWHALTIDAKPMTDENMAADGWVRLPVDADGEYIHVGDVMETDNGIREVDVLQKSSRKWSIGLVPVGGGAFSWRDAETLCHHHAPTVEDVLREFFSRYVTTKPKEEDDAIIAEYAAKLRLAERVDA